MATKREMLKGIMPLIFGLLVIVVVVIAVPSTVRLITKASGQPANLVFNLEGILGKMPTPWRNFAQGGEEPSDMLADVVSQVKALKPEYIRIDHIYDAFNVVSRVDGNLVYDWSKLDGAVNSILATGAKPFLSLSYMPSVIARGDIVSPARDWNEWGQVVGATIMHFSGVNQKNIDGVIYEVWNEPDLFGKFKTYGDSNYLEMYKAASKAAVNARGTNVFEIGGPATTGLYKNWLETLIKYVAKNNLRMDFISWHRYSTDLTIFEKDVAQARSWAENIPALVNLKYYITEWGFDSENNNGYDQISSAIHLLAAGRTMIGTADKSFVFEIKDGPGPSKLWGRWGLLTNQKYGAPEKKPRYSAVEFLNSLYPFRMSVSGEGSWVKSLASTNENGQIKIMVANYDPKGVHVESVPMTFENLPKGNFTFSRQNFLGESKTKKVATTSATWKTNEYFSANSAAMFTITFD